MSRISSEKFLMSSDKTIAGRCRLVGVTVSCNDNGGKIAAAVGTLSGKTLSFKNGTSSGVELFKFAVPVGTSLGYGCGIRPFRFMLGSNRILFEDGIFLAAAGNGTREIKHETQVIVYYEAG